MKLTDDGAMLMRLYSDKDLLTAECLRSGAWKGLDAPSLAAAVSALVHESRRDVVGETPRMPNRDVADALERTHELWSVIDEPTGRIICELDNPMVDPGDGTVESYRERESIVFRTDGDRLVAVHEHLSPFDEPTTDPAAD